MSISARVTTSMFISSLSLSFLPFLSSRRILFLSRSDGGLEVYHLRDSGDIENDADVIIMMYPEQMDMNKASYKDNVGEYKSMVYKIGKNREGERDLMGSFKFYNQYGRFY